MGTISFAALIVTVFVFAIPCFRGHVFTSQSAGSKSVFMSELKPGDSRLRVEQLFHREHIPYSFDRFQNRYQATIRDNQGTPYKAESLYVYLDSVGRVAKVEIFTSYTAP